MKNKEQIDRNFVKQASKSMNKLKKIGLALLIIFYLAAGSNHFLSPGGYLAIIPRYLPWPHTLNLLAGFFEIFFGAALLFKSSRFFAAWGIILMLLAFLPVHISMIGDAPLKMGNLMVTPFLAWLRFLVLQPLLIFWAWCYTKPEIES